MKTSSCRIKQFKFHSHLLRNIGYYQVKKHTYHVLVGELVGTKKSLSPPGGPGSAVQVSILSKLSKQHTSASAQSAIGH